MIKKEDLRKIKWSVDVEYHCNKGRLTEKQIVMYRQKGSYIYDDHKYEGKLIEELGEIGFNSIKTVRIYETGYFHQWIVENSGNSHEGFSTYTRALVEKENGRVEWLRPEQIIFDNSVEVLNKLKELLEKQKRLESEGKIEESIKVALELKGLTDKIKVIE